jgi:phospholipid/cholesterol/gamma-HCH transport system ATP-binding protein
VSRQVASRFSGGLRLRLELSRLIERAASYPEPPSASRPAGAGAGAVSAIEFRRVQTDVNRSPALVDFDLRIPARGIVAVIGAVGITKGAFVDHVLGRTEPDAGEIEVLGARSGALTSDERYRRALQVGIVLRDGGLFSSLSVRDNVAFLPRNEVHAEFEQLPVLVDEVIEELGLGRHADALPGDLALGQRKRAGLARALITNPSIILFDEPEAGLDRARTALFGELIEHVHSRRGGTYVVLTHDVTLARRIADRIVLIGRGRLLANGSPDQLAHSGNPFVRALIEGPAGAAA